MESYLFQLYPFSKEIKKNQRYILYKLDNSPLVLYWRDINSSLPPPSYIAVLTAHQFYVYVHRAVKRTLCVLHAYKS
jgi:hypothetical protein